jgi:hypothetical protein
VHYIYNVESDTTEIVVSFHCCHRSGNLAFVHYHGHEINDPFQSNRHLAIATHVGGFHNYFYLTAPYGEEALSHASAFCWRGKFSRGCKRKSQLTYILTCIQQLYMV